MFLRNMFRLFIVVFSLWVNVAYASSYSTIFSNNNFNITSLMNAVAQDDAKATEVFLKSGSNVNEKNMANVSPLHIAAKNNSINSMKILLQYGADINARDDEGWTPLMRACLNKNKESVEILVNNKANIWLKNIFGETALLHCTMSDCVECVEILKNNFKSFPYNDNVVIDEINKALVMTYKREDKEMEAVLNSFYDSVANVENADQNKKEKKKNNKENDNIKKEIEYIIRKVYLFQGEVRYLNKK